MPLTSEEIIAELERKFQPSNMQTTHMDSFQAGYDYCQSQHPKIDEEVIAAIYKSLPCYGHYCAFEKLDVNCQECTNKVLQSVLPIIADKEAKARKEERERISFLLATVAKCPSGICPQKKEPKFTCTQCREQALSQEVKSE
jgi:hypothetical protein